MNQSGPSGRGKQEHIEVILWDGTSQYVSRRALDVLLDNKRVKRFRRSSGWVTVGLDPVRIFHKKGVNGIYSGPERRATH